MRTGLVALRNICGFVLLLGLCWSVVTAVFAALYYFLTGRI